MAAAAWVLVSVTAGTLAQAVTGIGLVLVCGPVLLAIAGPADGVRLALITSLLLNASLLALHRKDVRYRDAMSLFVPAAFISVPLGLLLRDTHSRTAGAAAGAGIVLAAAASWRGRDLPWMRTTAGAVTAGAVTGAMNVLSATAGPVAALYAVNAGWTARARTATLQACFASLNIVSIAVIGMPSGWGLIAAAALGIAAGLGPGQLLARRAPAHLARRIVVIVAAAGGLAVIIQFIA
jgi:uncharacterized protein